MKARAYVYAAGGIGPQGSLELDYFSDGCTPLSEDAKPLPLRELLQAHTARTPRLASRFAELAVIGSQRCLRRLAFALPVDTRVYLATGLGDIARTDTLYYQVMPPSSEMASPAQFATSGNNMAAFFVAQQAGVTARNFTVSLEELSFEQALTLALEDLAAGACTTALVGAVDETTLPREFYVRRFPLAQDRRIGEGSAWLVLGARPESAIGEIEQVRLFQTPAETGSASVQTIAHSAADTLLTGCRFTPQQAAALLESVPGCGRRDYLAYTGCFPTAGALALAGAFQHVWPVTTRLLHVNCDAAGRTALSAVRVYSPTA